MKTRLALRVRRGARALLLAAVSLSLVAAPALGTWSIVLVNHETGEVALASATCIDGTLSEFVGVIEVGQGAAAAQASQSSFATKQQLRDEIVAGRTPKEILSAMAADGSFFSNQYGVASFTGPAATWHGTGVCGAHPARTGNVGPISYAIQGNILTGPQVVVECEKALLRAPGDVSQRLMAAMEAARKMGGDGRCSCEAAGLCSGSVCGSPPTGFDPATDLSACIGFVFVTRIGDEDAPCAPATGCANGDYYLRIEHSSADCDVDPMVPLQAQYAEWRASLQGRPDHVLSQVDARGLPLVADGATEARVRVELVDVEGVPVPHGGHEFSLDVPGDRPPETQLTGVEDHGDGTYTLTLASSTAGVEALEIQCDDFSGPQVTFYPRLEVEALVPATVLTDLLGAAERGGWERHAFTVHGGRRSAGHPVAVFAGLAGSEAGPAPLVATGLLDAEGRLAGHLELPGGAEAEFTVVRLAEGGELRVTRS